MTQKLSFWAQNLTNQGDDSYNLEGAMLQSSQTKEISEVVRRVSRVTENGERIDVGSANVRGTILSSQQGTELVFHIYPLNQDIAGRQSPIACHSTLPEEETPDWQPSIVFQMEKFAQELERTLPKELDADIGKVVREMFKKKVSGWIVYSCIAAMFLVLLIALRLWFG